MFMVGGGNYIEYQNLMELAQSKGGGGISSPSGASVSLLSPGIPKSHFPMVHLEDLANLMILMNIQK